MQPGEIAIPGTTCMSLAQSAIFNAESAPVCNGFFRFIAYLRCGCEAPAPVSNNDAACRLCPDGSDTISPNAMYDTLTGSTCADAEEYFLKFGENDETCTYYQQQGRQNCQCTTPSPTHLPSYSPSFRPSVSPSLGPTPSPTPRPTHGPSAMPTTHPSFTPNAKPTSSPSMHPSMTPTDDPTLHPSFLQSSKPTSPPTIIPTDVPTLIPSFLPSAKPTSSPSIHPSTEQSNIPSLSPTFYPNFLPSKDGSMTPSTFPSMSPSKTASSTPSTHPTLLSSVKPSISKSESPSSKPNSYPSVIPTLSPSSSPSAKPTTQPSFSLSEEPSLSPSEQISSKPSIEPSIKPSNPTIQPSLEPSPSGPSGVINGILQTDDIESTTTNPLFYIGIGAGGSTIIFILLLFLIRKKRRRIQSGYTKSQFLPSSSTEHRLGRNDSHNYNRVFENTDNETSEVLNRTFESAESIQIIETGFCDENVSDWFDSLEEESGVSLNPIDHHNNRFDEGIQILSQKSFLSSDVFDNLDSGSENESDVFSDIESDPGCSAKSNEADIGYNSDSYFVFGLKFPIKEKIDLHSGIEP